jgi:hypothetical protein
VRSRHWARLVAAAVLSLLWPSGSLYPVEIQGGLEDARSEKSDRTFGKSFCYSLTLGSEVYRGQLRKMNRVLPLVQPIGREIDSTPRTFGSKNSTYLLHIRHFAGGTTPGRHR